MSSRFSHLATYVRILFPFKTKYLSIVCIYHISFIHLSVEDMSSFYILASMNKATINMGVCYSVGQLCPAVCDPMDCSMPCFPVIHRLISSFQLSLLVMPNSLRPYGLKHGRLSCPSPIPRPCSNSCPSSWWCHPTILASIVPFSSCLQSFPTSGFFEWVGSLPKWPKYWSFTFSISPSNEYQDWFPLGLTGLNSLLSKGLSRVSFNTTVQKHQFFGTQPSLWSNSHIHIWLLEKP